MAGVLGITIDQHGRVLAQRRADNGLWCIPGGILDPGEEPGPGVAREILEETGIEVLPERIVGVYSGPDCLTLYPNGEKVLFIDSVMACRPVGGAVRINDDESLDVGFFAPDALPAIPRMQVEYVAQALKNDLCTHFHIGAVKGQPLMSMSDYVHTIREKIGHDLLLLPGAVAVILNPAGEVLLQRRSDNGQWGLPGGAIDPGEEPADAVIREVREETGLDVLPERIVGVYSGPDHLITYPNGDQAMIVSVTFACRPIGGEARVNDDESLEVRYFPPDGLPPMAERNRFRLEHARRSDPRTHFRMNSIQEAP